LRPSSGKTKTGAFWTDATSKADYRHLLEYLVNRRNTVNGLRYRDEPAILAWQFGQRVLRFCARPETRSGPMGGQGHGRGRSRWRRFSAASTRII